jgi:alanyl-tRNA synthetase
MQNLGEAHPIFAGREQFVMDTMRREEESFLRTVHTGLELLDKECLQAQAKGEKSLAAAPVFLLYDTFGFPRDLTSVVLKEKGMSFDEAGFDTLMEGQRQRARKAQKFSSSMKWETKEYIEQSEGLFVGYEQLSCEAKVARVSQSAETELIKVVLDKTPFYAESGGQVGDRGHLKQEGCTLLVIDTQKEEGQIVHTCEILEGHLNPEMPVMAIVDSILRDRTRRNHTAVHLLQGILREKLGEHIQQAGSLVDAERFRFDFSHPVALTPEEISEIESELFQRINSGKKLLVHNKPLDEARKMGALCPFGEKYSDIVRVIEVPGFSMEFCGGTHVSDISEIGMVKITSESSISAGVRRIEGIVASAAFDLFQKEHEAFEGIKQSLKVKDGILDRVIGLQEELRQKEKEILKLKTEISQGSLNRMYEDVLVINGVKVLCAGFLELDAKVFKTLPDQAVQKLGSSILVFGNQSEGKASLLCRVSEDLVKSGYDAQKILAPLAEIVGGRGGGRPNLAQAGGNLPQKMDMALTEAKKLVTGILSQ